MDNLNDYRLNDYRRLACDRIEIILNQFTVLTEADYWLDDIIRDLSALPNRPSGRKAYEGILGANRTLDDWRDRACNRLFSLLSQVKDEIEIDLMLDGWIRRLSDLPERNENSNPYERLFILGARPTPETVDLFDIKVPEIITLSQLFEIVGSRKYETRISNLYPGLMIACSKHQIDSMLRMSHFLAQILHESQGFRYLREIWGPTEQQLRYEPPSPLATKLGNIKPGDGIRYMGRTPIQVTGRDNYVRLSEWAGFDFENKPEELEKSQHINLGPAWFWVTRKLNKLADKDDVRGVTKVVNGGYNGLADRQRYLRRAKSVLIES